jgi:hypothetical protein
MGILPYPLDIPLPGPDPRNKAINAYLPAGGEFQAIHSGNPPLDAEAVATIRAGFAYRLYVWGEVRYFDVFNIERKTKFRLEPSFGAAPRHHYVNRRLKIARRNTHRKEIDANTSIVVTRQKRSPNEVIYRSPIRAARALDENRSLIPSAGSHGLTLSWLGGAGSLRRRRLARAPENSPGWFARHSSVLDGHSASRSCGYRRGRAGRR